MAGAEGYRFIFFSVIFYAFIGFMLTLGASEFLTASIPDFASVTQGNILVEIFVIFTNPLSAYGFLAWLSVGIFVTDCFIILTSVIP